jgi:biopolymer transport protein ExbB
MSKPLRNIAFGSILCFGLAMIIMATHGQAQDPATSAVGTNAAPTMVGTDKTLWDWFVIGGWCMWPLLACSIVATGYIIFNYIVLRKKKLLRTDLVPSLQAAFQQLDFVQAKQICDQNPSLFTNILVSSIERAQTSGLDLAAMDKAMEEASTEQMSTYIVPINVINTVAVVAPMIGLLGTVSGMIKAFFTIGGGGMGKPEMLANNIGEALITTEAGLIIAIPAMTFYFLLKTGFIKCVAQAARQIGGLTDILRPYINGQMPLPTEAAAPAAPTEPAA